MYKNYFKIWFSLIIEKEKLVFCRITNKNLIFATGSLKNFSKLFINSIIYIFRIIVKFGKPLLRCKIFMYFKYILCSVTQSCPTLCSPVDCSLPGYSVNGRFQAKYWNRLPCPTPGTLPNLGIEPCLRSPSLAGGFFTNITPWEAPSSFCH